MATTGKGTRNWSNKRKAEILTKGKAKGFYGHHIKSVKAYPKHAGNPNNIRFVTRKEHLSLHGGNWRNPTTGKFIYRNKRMKR
ncbi:hypothetical protein ACS2U0_18675 [Bacillus cereus group sp. BC251]|uniref:hypothetical protein n=1 Tax=Bacillus cereus group TaxID=86661 RepID=UPI0038B5A33D